MLSNLVEGQPCRCRLCEPNVSEVLEDEEARVLDVVRRHGWMVTLIASAGSLPGWAFTSGLTHSFHWPELVMTGLPGGTLHACLNIVGEHARRGEACRLSAPLDDVLEGYNVVLRPADAQWNPSLFGWSQWFAQHVEPAFVHVVWPDAAGRYPGQTDFNNAIAHLQPDLSVPPFQHPHGPWRAIAAEAAWPGRHRSNGLVFVSRSLVDDDVPVLVVGLDADGDWSFTDGTASEDPREVTLAHVAHLLLKDPELEQHIALRPGQTAWRTAPGARWQIADDEPGSND